ncbi:replication licensing factor Cdt1, partial [Entophlyctis luteolus]
MCNRDFSLQSLCQILAIVPSLFKITPLKVLVDTDIGKKENSLMLEMVGETSPTKENPAENARVTPYKEVLEQRLHLFDSECERLVEIAHDKFLGSLPKSDREYDTTAAKYHPKFKINEDVPEVVGIAIPDVKNVSTQKCIPESTKEDENTFENSDVIVGDDSKLPSDGGSKNCEKTPDEILESPVKPQMSRAAALLERIRAREKAKEDAHNSLKLSPSELKHRAMIGRLVEVARGIMCFFNQKGKTALPMKEVCEYVVTSVRSSVSYEEAREHIVLLAQIMPDLCKVSKLSIGTVVVFSTEMPEIVAK